MIRVSDYHSYERWKTDDISLVRVLVWFKGQYHSTFLYEDKKCNGILINTKDLKVFYGVEEQRWLWNI